MKSFYRVFALLILLTVTLAIGSDSRDPFVEKVDALNRLFVQTFQQKDFDQAKVNKMTLAQQLDYGKEVTTLTDPRYVKMISEMKRFKDEMRIESEHRAKQPFGSVGLEALTLAAGKYLDIQARLYPLYAKIAHSDSRGVSTYSFDELDSLNLVIHSKVGLNFAQELELKRQYNIRHHKSANWTELFISENEKRDAEYVSLLKPRTQKDYGKLLQFAAIQETMVNRWAIRRLQTFSMPDQPINSCGSDLLSFRLDGAKTLSGSSTYQSLNVEDHYLTFNQLKEPLKQATLNHPLATKARYQALTRKAFYAFPEFEKFNVPYLLSSPEGSTLLKNILDNETPDNLLLNEENLWAADADMIIHTVNFPADDLSAEAVAKRITESAFRNRKKILVDTLAATLNNAGLLEMREKPLASIKKISSIVDQEFAGSMPQWLKEQEAALVTAYRKNANTALLASQVQTRLNETYDKITAKAMGGLKAQRIHSLIEKFEKDHAAMLSHSAPALSQARRDGKERALHQVPSSEALPVVIQPYTPEQLRHYFAQTLTEAQKGRGDSRSKTARDFVKDPLPGKYAARFFARLQEAFDKALRTMKIEQVTAENSPLAGLINEAAIETIQEMRAAMLKDAPRSKSGSPMVAMPAAAEPTVAKPAKDALQLKSPILDFILDSALTQYRAALKASIKKTYGREALPYKTPMFDAKLRKLFIDQLSTLNLGNSQAEYLTQKKYLSEIVDHHFATLGFKGRKSLTADEITGLVASRIYLAFEPSIRKTNLKPKNLLVQHADAIRVAPVIIPVEQREEAPAEPEDDRKSAEKAVSLDATFINALGWIGFQPSGAKADLSITTRNLQDQKHVAKAIINEALVLAPILHLDVTVLSADPTALAFLTSLDPSGALRDFVTARKTRIYAIHYLAEAYNLKTGTLDNSKGKEVLSRLVAFAARHDRGKLEDFCQANPGKPETDENFKKLFRASTALREILKDGHAPSKNFDSSIRLLTRSSNEALLEDVLDPLLMVGMAALLIYMAVQLAPLAWGFFAGTSVTAGAAAAPPLFTAVFWFQLVGFSLPFATQAMIQVKVNFIELPPQLAYQISAANSQIGMFAKPVVSREAVIAQSEKLTTDQNWTIVNIAGVLVDAHFSGKLVRGALGEFDRAALRRLRGTEAAKLAEKSPLPAESFSQMVDERGLLKAVKAKSAQVLDEVAGKGGRFYLTEQTIRLDLIEKLSQEVSNIDQWRKAYMQQIALDTAAAAKLQQEAISIGKQFSRNQHFEHARIGADGRLIAPEFFRRLSLLKKVAGYRWRVAVGKVPYNELAAGGLPLSWKRAPEMAFLATGAEARALTERAAFFERALTQLDQIPSDLVGAEKVQAHLVSMLPYSNQLGMYDRLFARVGKETLEWKNVPKHLKDYKLVRGALKNPDLYVDFEGTIRALPPAKEAAEESGAYGKKADFSSTDDYEVLIIDQNDGTATWEKVVGTAASP